MNEFFTADPDCLKSVGDLRYLFGLFGPYTGRYLAAYPTDWVSRVLDHFSHLPDVEQERVKTILRRAGEGASYLNNSSLPWSSQVPWLANALSIKMSIPPRIDEVISSANQTDALPFDDLTIPNTADEKIEATPDGYVRIARTLISISGELFFIDPYLSPCRRDIRVVIEALLKKVVSCPKCRSVIFYARMSNVIGKSGFKWGEIVSTWIELLAGVKWKADRHFRYVLVDDDSAACKMHGRYLFSVKGGIRLDQGFQRLPKGRTVDVSPVGKLVHEELLSTYLDRNPDMKSAYEFVP